MCPGDISPSVVLPSQETFQFTALNSLLLGQFTVWTDGRFGTSKHTKTKYWDIISDGDCLEREDGEVGLAICV